MKLKDWVESKISEAGTTGAVRAARSRLFERMAFDLGLSVRIIRYYAKGTPVSDYLVAKRIAHYTGYQVTIEDLCEPSPC